MTAPSSPRRRRIDPAKPTGRALIVTAYHYAQIKAAWRTAWHESKAQRAARRGARVS